MKPCWVKEKNTTFAQQKIFCSKDCLPVSLGASALRFLLRWFPKGISYSNVPPSGSMLNFGRVVSQKWQETSRCLTEFHLPKWHAHSPNFDHLESIKAWFRRSSSSRRYDTSRAGQAGGGSFKRRRTISQTKVLPIESFVTTLID